MVALQARTQPWQVDYPLCFNRLPQTWYMYCAHAFVTVLPLSQGVGAVIAQSFDAAHRANLASMGVLPLQFLLGQSVDTFSITGMEDFTIKLPQLLTPNQKVEVSVSLHWYHVIRMYARSQDQICVCSCMFMVCCQCCGLKTMMVVVCQIS